MSSPQLIPSEARRAQTKLQNALENEFATELIDQNVSFDFKKFLDEVGPTPSFGEPLGSTPQCLSVDLIRSYHLDELTETTRTVVQQHITVCTTCSGHVTSYGTAQPGGMPEELFQRVSNRIRSKSVMRAGQDPVIDTKNRRRFVWPAPTQFLRRVAAPAMALLVLLWVFSPATPYLQEATSRFSDAWVAFRGKDTATPNNPSELQRMLNNLVQASNRGQLPPPHKVDRMLESVSMKSTLTEPNDPSAPLWITGRTQLAAFDAASHYEALRKRTSSDAVSLEVLKISQLRDVDGVPAIAVDSDEVYNPIVQTLLEKGVAQSGIPRLYVFQGSKLVYDISTKAENSAPTSK
jgi:hypothetical protein